MDRRSIMVHILSNGGDVSGMLPLCIFRQSHETSVLVHGVAKKGLGLLY